jgi:hypothetical protein
MQMNPKIGYKRFFIAMFLGASLHLTGQEVAQYMAAGRVITYLTDPSYMVYPPPSLIERILGFRFNAGKYRMNAFVKDFLDNQTKTVDDQNGN